MNGEDQDRPPLAFKLLISLVSVILLLVAAEGLASVLLAWKDVQDESGMREELHCQHDPDLGWTHTPSVHIGDLYGRHRDLTTNARGLRALEEYTDEIPDGRYRVICVGDSFTLGYGVDDEATYEAEMEAQQPRIQALNMGQGGYGVDQAYLWYRRDAEDLEHDLVVFAYIAPDFDRMTSTRFNGLYSKPVLRAQEGRLIVDGVPVPDDFSGGGQSPVFERLALSDLLRRATREERREETLEQVGTPLAFREVAELMIADLVALCEQRGSALVLVQLPLLDSIAGRPREVSAWMRGVARSHDVPFFNLAGRFEALPSAERELYYQEDGHYNALGNRLVAQELLLRMAETVPGFPGS